MFLKKDRQGSSSLHKCFEDNAEKYAHTYMYTHTHMCNVCAAVIDDGKSHFFCSCLAFLCLYFLKYKEHLYLTLQKGIYYTILMLFSLLELTHHHFWCKWGGSVYQESVNVTNRREKMLLVPSISGYTTWKNIASFVHDLWYQPVPIQEILSFWIKESIL